MAVDEALLEAAEADGQCTIRFYRWEEPTLSLGYFQTYADRWQHEASRQSAVVRRSSGGGAIMHDLELTYSVAVPANHPLAVNRLGFYQAMHTALIEALGQWGVEAELYEEKAEGGGRKAEGVVSGQWPVAGESKISNPQSLISNPSFSALHPPPSALASPFLCFQRRSPGDVLVGDVKIAGSAQRRCRGAVLQHGSVLFARSPAAPELSGLRELVDTRIEPQSLIDAWLAKLGKALPIQWQIGGLSASQFRRASALVTEKYASPAWTEDRGR
jgi:lipoate-protein ligase A